MKKSILLLIAFFLVLQIRAQDHPDYRTLFWEQLAQTCMTPVKWEKSIQDLTEEASHGTQNKVFTVDCRKGFAVNIETGEKQAIQLSEFAQLFEWYYEHPRISDYFDVTYDGGSVKAMLKSDHSGDTPLQLQVFNIDAVSGKLRYAEAHILKDNLLYDLEMKIKIWFEADGKYLKHELETLMTAVLSGGVHTLIKGKRAL